MGNLIIIGAGGMGRIFYDLARESFGYGNEFVIRGFVDDGLTVLNGFNNYPHLLGRICEYEPQINDVFISSIGGKPRVKCSETIVERGGNLINLIHSTARIGTNVTLGIGNLIGAYVSIDSDYAKMIILEDHVQIAALSILLCHQRDLSNYFVGDD